MANNDDRNCPYVYIHGLSYLDFMDIGISPKNLPLYKGKSAEGGKGSFVIGAHTRSRSDLVGSF